MKRALLEAIAKIRPTQWAIRIWRLERPVRTHLCAVHAVGVPSLGVQSCHPARVTLLERDVAIVKVHNASIHPRGVAPARHLRPSSLGLLRVVAHMAEP